MTVTKAHVDAFLAGADAIIKTYNTRMGHIPAPALTASYGKRYIRIVREGSAFAFIDASNGDVLKADGWKRPAKHARGNVLAADGGLTHIGPYGPAYLR